VLSSVLFPDHEAVRLDVSYIKAIRVTVWRQEDVVVISPHERSEVTVEVNIGLPLFKLADAEVLEPALRTFHTV
jgi:hypothetical protein